MAEQMDFGHLERKNDAFLRVWSKGAKNPGAVACARTQARARGMILYLSSISPFDYNNIGKNICNILKLLCFMGLSVAERFAPFAEKQPHCNISNGAKIARKPQKSVIGEKKK